MNLSSSLPDGLTTRFDGLGYWLNYLFSYGTFLTPFGPALLSLTLVFPKPKGIVRRHPWIPLAPFGIGAACLALMIAFRLEALAVAIILLLVITSIANLVHSALTMREAVSRAQLQWGLGGLMLGLLVTLLAFPAAFRWVTGPWAEVSNSAFSVGFTLIGVTLSVAILRYRLFDIDLIIRRTLIYSALTAGLALAYFSSVLVLESVSRFITGRGQNSLVVVLSTLAIAALFGPLRSRVQRAIDRRFFRQKYDATRTLAAFAMAARDEVDLDRLSAQLVDVVEHSMQPEQVSLWLRPNPRGIAGRPATDGREQP